MKDAAHKIAMSGIQSHCLFFQVAAAQPIIMGFYFLISAFIRLILPKIIPFDLDRISTRAFSVPRNDFLNHLNNFSDSGKKESL